MILSQAASPSSGIVSHLLTVVTVCILVGLLIAVRWGITRLRALLSEVTGPWRWIARIAEGALVLAFALIVLSVAIGIFSFVFG